LRDLGLITNNSSHLLLDPKKIKRERMNMGKFAAIDNCNKNASIIALYFDGKKDLTRVLTRKSSTNRR
jgi:hypothetical protein